MITFIVTLFVSITLKPFGTTNTGILSVTQFPVLGKTPRIMYNGSTKGLSYTVIKYECVLTIPLYILCSFQNKSILNLPV